MGFEMVTQKQKQSVFITKKQTNKPPKNWFHKILLKIPQNQLKRQSVSRVRTFIMHLFPVRLSKRNAKKPLELLLVDFKNDLS